MDEASPVTRRDFIAGASTIVATAAVGASLTQAQATGNAPSSPSASARLPSPGKWPVLKRYDADHLRRIAMPLGGIGTGTIAIGGRGNLQDFELVNRPAKGYTPPNTFFALWAKPQNGEAVTRCIEGPYDTENYQGSSGAVGRNHGLPRFRNCNFAAAYPMGQVLLQDDAVSLQVRIEAFNPMTPVDTDLSGLPVAILRFVLINATNTPIQASVCGTMENFIGWEGNRGKVDQNVNEFRGEGSGPVRGIFMHSEGVKPDSTASGTLALATTATNVTHRTMWAELSWGDSLLDFWDDFSDDGKLEARKSTIPAPFGSVAAMVDVPANGEAAVTFLIGWRFPNRINWNEPRERIGNYYCTQFSDAWDAVTKVAPRLEELETKTIDFVRSFVDSDLPPVVKEAALFNASTLRTQTSFRAEDGRFYGWEGCNDYDGCCHGSCTHVWNYEHATPFLYGSLARMMREIEFGHATQKNGYQSFRVNLPLIHAQETKPAAADGQMGTIMKLYREWRLSGDEKVLKTLWPYAKAALQFAWGPGGWDADRDGVMEGCQHNTMDIEYYGPNPEVGVWYLGALRAGEEMAKAVGDDPFAQVCGDLFRRGSSWFDANLFNGGYYEQHIVPAKDEKAIAEGLRLGAGAKDLAHPELQLGAGCLTDQLVGQVMASVTGLGHLLNENNIRTTLASIRKHNYCSDLSGHFNHLRTYALGNEAGTIIATYPRGNRPKRPFPYAFEVWTGLEYTAAAGMFFEGMNEAGLQIVQAVRDRHEGRKRNPFDEPECGHHYARAMASWAMILAMTGFHYDGVDQLLRFASSPKPAMWFWSNGDAWGTFTQKPANGAVAVTLEVKGGTLKLARIELAEAGKHILPAARELKAGERLEANVRAS